MDRYAHRIGTKQLKVEGKNGVPLSNQQVDICQKKHKFLFGCSEFTSIMYANNEIKDSEKEFYEERYNKFTNLFNYVTLPFYWANFEPIKGQPKTAKFKNAAKLWESKGLVIKGHPLCWHTLAPTWLLELNNADIIKEQLNRIYRDVTDFAGLIDMWDVINEVVIMPIFDKYDNGITRICNELGAVKLVSEVFKAAKESNPNAFLLINDFNTSEEYARAIEILLEADVPIDAIGIQSHMHQGYWGIEKTEKVLERFSRFKLPIHFTENTLVSGHIMPPEIEDLNDYQIPEWPTTQEGEERQAREAVMHYKTLFAHPLVESITWWDFADGAWLRAPSGFLTKENRVKPVYNEIYNLVKNEWWLNKQSFTTDENGFINLKGYFGEYELTYKGNNVTFELNNQDQKITLNV
ncbi:endo-1,4-beta-xylanase [Ruminiclostridium herbifermentans]|uniref:Beta-xylanase n=1 Tax=Ruminiclostridium herbifermentans TaxID=2488810 RepID=A0A4U7JII5_9FIRM|nr:endo-1,4-beta-xylanase [Ruminiclostridium herbifermentans]QNU67164.1 endo-1,4-beta-xylanase [Ruminiclostridium herbifermentans]